MARPTTYQRRPRVIEAMQLIPGTDNWKDVCDWMKRDGAVPEHIGRGRIQWDRMQAGPTDFVVLIGGQFGVINQAQFEHDYEEA